TAAGGRPGWAGPRLLLPVAGRRRVDQPAAAAAAAPAGPGPGRRRRPADPAGQRAHPAPADGRERTPCLPRRASGPDRGTAPAGAGDRAVPARRGRCRRIADPVSRGAGPGRPLIVGRDITGIGACARPRAPGLVTWLVPVAGQGTTVTGHRPARTSRTAREPISRWPALA